MEQTGIVVDDNFYPFTGTVRFLGLEPGVAFHSGAGMRGFTADFILRTGIQYNKVETSIFTAKSQHFNIGPEAGIGFNTYIFDKWGIGARAGIGFWAGDYSYVRLMGGLHVFRAF